HAPTRTIIHPLPPRPTPPTPLSPYTTLFRSFACARQHGNSTAAALVAAPTLLSSTPGDGTNFVAIPSSLSLVFSEAVDTTVNALDRKSTRLNSSHSQISYAVF